MNINMNVLENFSREIEAAIAASDDARGSAGKLLRTLIEEAGSVQQLAAKGQAYCQSFGVRAEYDEDNLSENAIIINWDKDDGVTYCSLQQVILACHDDSLPEWFQSAWITGAPFPEDNFDTYSTPKDANDFERFGTGAPIVIVQYSYSEKEMTLTRSWHQNARRRGRDTVTIDDDELDELQAMACNDFIGPADVFNAASGGQLGDWGM